MADTVRLFHDAAYAIGLMALAGILAGFASAALTGDAQRSLQIGLAVFAVTGAWLSVRLWRVARTAGLRPAGPGGSSGAPDSLKNLPSRG